MGQYGVICIDMFQTLVDVNTRVAYIWKRILKDNYTENLMKKYVSEVNTKIIKRFHGIENKKDFRNLKTIFLENFTEIFKEAGESYCPIKATNVLIQEHNQAGLYADSIEFMERARKKYPVCLVSDADTEMVQDFVDDFNFDNIFISEKIHSYKGHSDNKMFQEVIRYYGIDPSNIIHIGDSSSDIVGAKKAGIDPCWLNRNHKVRDFDIQPKYEIATLTELFPILDI